MPTTSIRIADELDAQIEALAQELDRSKSWIIIRAVKEYLERVDDEKQRWLETRSALESKAKGKVISSEDLQTWMKTWYTAKEQPVPRKRK